MLKKIIFVILLGILINYIKDYYVGEDLNSNNKDTLNNQDDTNANQIINEKKLYTADDLKNSCQNNKYFLAILGFVYDVTKGEKVCFHFIYLFDL